jgi:type I restriction enzyme M protein
LIKATDLVERKNTESYLTSEHINTILSIYRQFTNIEGRSCVVDKESIPVKNYTISPKYYVKSMDNGDSENLDVLLQRWNDSSKAFHDSFSSLIQDLV